MITNKILKLSIIVGLSFSPHGSYGFLSIDSLMNQASQQLESVKEASSEFIQDHTTFNDGPIRNAIAPVVKRLVVYRNNRIAQIDQIRTSNPILAKEMEELEADKTISCRDLNLESRLEMKLEENCKVESVRITCMQSHQTVSSVFKTMTSVSGGNGAKNTPEALFELELSLANKVETARSSNVSCSESFAKSITSPVCTSTYRNFFEEIDREIMENCATSQVLEKIDSFVVQMRDPDFGMRSQISQIFRLHTKSRNIEIKLAETLEKVNAARIKIEKTLQTEPANSDLTSQSKQTNIQENMM